MSDSKRDLVTVIQEHLGNTSMVVRLNGKVVGKVLQWGPNDWRIVPVRPQSFETLEDVVEWLCEQNR